MEMINGEYILDGDKFHGPCSLSNKDLYESLHDGMVKNSHRVALIDATSGEETTFGQLLKEVEVVSYHLQQQGVVEGTLFAICSTNCKVYVLLMLALLRLGAVAVLLGGLTTPNELSHYLSTVPAQYIYTNAEEKAQAALNMKTVKKAFTDRAYPGCTAFSALCEPLPPGVNPPLPAKVGPQHTAFILFSSGTTGMPKGVETSRDGMLKGCEIYGNPHLKLSEGPFILFVPMAHIIGTAYIVSNILSGDLIVIMRQFVLETFLGYIKKLQVTHLAVVPPILVLLAKSPQVTREHLSTVKYIICGAAPVGPALEQQLKDKFGHHLLIRQVFGMTEMIGVTTVPVPQHQPAPVPMGTVGLPFQYSKVKVVDITSGTSLPVGEQGEIVVKGPAVMKSYYGNPKATAQALDKHGWYHTGDIGYYDKNGYLFVVDRLKELIKYKAYQVPPAELEELLLSHPDIADAGVVGLPDTDAGELPHAWVVSKPGSSVNEQQIQEFVKGKLAPYKQLRGGVKFVEAIPKSASGKILRRQIKQMSIETMGKKSKL